MCGFGVEPEVELVPRIGGKLGVARLRAEAAAHDDDTLRHLGEVRIDRNGERNICERAGGVDRYLMRMRVDLANEKVRGVFRPTALAWGFPPRALG